MAQHPSSPTFQHPHSNSPNVTVVMDHPRNRVDTLTHRLFPDHQAQYAYNQSGALDDPTWNCTIHLDDCILGTGDGPSKGAAADCAARAAILYLHCAFYQKKPEAFQV